MILSFSVIQFLFDVFLICYNFDITNGSTTRMNDRQSSITTAETTQEQTEVNQNMTLINQRIELVTQLQKTKENISSYQSETIKSDLVSGELSQTTPFNDADESVTTTLIDSEKIILTDSPAESTAEFVDSSQSTYEVVENQTSSDVTSNELAEGYSGNVNVSGKHEMLSDNGIITQGIRAVSPITTITIPVVSVTNTIKNTINSTKTPQHSKSALLLILGSIFGSLAVIVLISSVITYVLIKCGYIKVFNHPRTRIKDIERNKISDSSSSIGLRSPSRR